jgi:serine/threonine protein kinase
VIGTILHDRWRILAELGRGGMGEVYLAEHIALGRKEAIKILMPSLAADPQFVSRFRREARAVNRCGIPTSSRSTTSVSSATTASICRWSTPRASRCIGLLKMAGRFDIPRALHVLGQLAYAVHHAHFARCRASRSQARQPDPRRRRTKHSRCSTSASAKIVASDHQESMALSTSNLVWGLAALLCRPSVRAAPVTIRAATSTRSA